jgi:hypothetical protein
MSLLPRLSCRCNYGGCTFVLTRKLTNTCSHDGRTWCCELRLFLLCVSLKHDTFTGLSESGEGSKFFSISKHFLTKADHIHKILMTVRIEHTNSGDGDQLRKFYHGAGQSCNQLATFRPRPTRLTSNRRFCNQLPRCKSPHLGKWPMSRHAGTKGAKRKMEKSTTYAV